VHKELFAKANIREVTLTACEKLKEHFKENNFREVGSLYGNSCITSLTGDVSNCRKFCD